MTILILGIGPDPIGYPPQNSHCDMAGQIGDSATTNTAELNSPFSLAKNFSQRY
jgi:hypothetical protein